MQQRDTGQRHPERDQQLGQVLWLVTMEVGAGKHRGNPAFSPPATTVLSRAPARSPSEQLHSLGNNAGGARQREIIRRLINQYMLSRRVEAPG